jgi:hypothetical protein
LRSCVLVILFFVRVVGVVSGFKKEKIMNHRNHGTTQKEYKRNKNEIECFIFLHFSVSFSAFSGCKKEKIMNHRNHGTTQKEYKRNKNEIECFIFLHFSVSFSAFSGCKKEKIMNHGHHRQHGQGIEEMNFLFLVLRPCGWCG